MYNKRLAILTFFFVLVSLQTFAQAEISFDNTNHDFGEVTEGDIATYEFTFTNTGSEPLVLSNVRASCGCTTPFWTRDPVLPGKRGSIKASYNSKGRPGVFNKSITVTSNAATGRAVLFLKGSVIPGGNNQPTEAEIAQSPIAKFGKTSVALGKIQQNQLTPVKLTVKNEGQSRLVLKNLSSKCNCFFFDNGSARVIEPGNEGEIKLIYRPAAIGNMQELLTFTTNDLTQKAQTIQVTGSVVQDLGQNSPLKQKSDPFKQ